MALTELQLPLKTDFYRNIQNTAQEIHELMMRWDSVADFIGRMGTADMDAMGVAAGQVRTDLTNFRTLLNEIIQLYNGTATTPTNNPSVVVDAIRKMR